MVAQNPGTGREQDMLEKIGFGPEAIVYIREQLSLGKTLATYLLRLQLEEGRVIAYLPASMGFVERCEFKVGIPSATQESLTRLQTFLSEYLCGVGKR